jgi:hypothetical protein
LEEGDDLFQIPVFPVYSVKFFQRGPKIHGSPLFVRPWGITFWAP